MASGRREKKTDKQSVEAIRFTPLDEARWEDSGYLPSGEDQSWREMEAVRIAAYDRIGHLPPQDDQSWREREALRLAAAREVSDARESAEQNQDEYQDYSDQNGEPDQGYDQDREPLTADFIPAPKMPVAELPSVRRGSGGVLLLLLAVVGLVTAALASPEILTPGFWRAQWSAAGTKPARTVNSPAPVALRPSLQSPPAPLSGPALNPQLPARAEPPTRAEPPANATPPAPPVISAMPEAAPSPRPDTGTSAAHATMVIGQDGTVKYEDAAAGSKPGRSRRAAVPDDRGGFYAMAPGPDGKLQRQFFPSRPPPPGSGHVARAPSRDEAGGVYAMAPGPDGKLTYQYFPTRPAR